MQLHPSAFPSELFIVGQQHVFPAIIQFCGAEHCNDSMLGSLDWNSEELLQELNPVPDCVHPNNVKQYADAYHAHCESFAVADTYSSAGLLIHELDFDETDKCISSYHVISNTASHAIACSGAQSRYRCHSVHVIHAYADRRRTTRRRRTSMACTISSRTQECTCTTSQSIQVSSCISSHNTISVSSTPSMASISSTLRFAHSAEKKGNDAGASPKTLAQHARSDRQLTLTSKTLTPGGMHSVDKSDGSLLASSDAASAPCCGRNTYSFHGSGAHSAPRVHRNSDGCGDLNNAVSEGRHNNNTPQFGPVTKFEMHNRLARVYEKGFTKHRSATRQWLPKQSGLTEYFTIADAKGDGDDGPGEDCVPKGSHNVNTHSCSTRGEAEHTGWQWQNGCATEWLAGEWGSPNSNEPQEKHMAWFSKGGKQPTRTCPAGESPPTSYREFRRRVCAEFDVHKALAKLKQKRLAKPQPLNRWSGKRDSGESKYTDGFEEFSNYNPDGRSGSADFSAHTSNIISAHTPSKAISICITTDTSQSTRTPNICTASDGTNEIAGADHCRLPGLLDESIADVSGIDAISMISIQTEETEPSVIFIGDKAVRVPLSQLQNFELRSNSAQTELSHGDISLSRYETSISSTAAPIACSASIPRMISSTQTDGVQHKTRHSQTAPRGSVKEVQIVACEFHEPPQPCIGMQTCSHECCESGIQTFGVDTCEQGAQAVNDSINARTQTEIEDRNSCSVQTEFDVTAFHKQVQAETIVLKKCTDDQRTQIAAHCERSEMLTEVLIDLRTQLSRAQHAKTCAETPNSQTSTALQTIITELGRISNNHEIQCNAELNWCDTNLVPLKMWAFDHRNKKRIDLVGIDRFPAVHHML